MELWRYYRILRRRKWLIVIGMLVCTAVTYVVVWRAPVMYRARTTLMERHPGTETGVPIYRDVQAMQMDIDVRLSNLANILTSDTVIMRTANSLALLGISVDPGKILENTTVQPVRTTEILAVEVRSTDPDEARDAANELVNQFRIFYAELAHGATRESREFIASQLPKAKAELDRVQKALRAYKEQSDVTVFDSQSTLMLQRATSTQNELSSAEIAAAETANRLKVIRDQLRGQPQMRVAALTTAQNPIWQGLATDLARLEAQLAFQEQTRGPKHPTVAALKDQIAETRAKMDAEKQNTLSSTTEQLNPIYNAVLDRYVATKVDNIGHTARAKGLRAVLAQQKAALASLPAKEMELMRLELERRAAQETYTLLRTKLDEATIKEQETKSGSSIKIIDPARAVPVNQQKGFKVALAAILSPLLMCALAFLLHYLDNSIRTAEEAEQLLGLPITAVVPLSRAHNLARQPQAEPLTVSYQILADHLWHEAEHSGRNTFLVASAEPGTGRTITAANLAVVLARDGSRVILIDSDLRRPRLHAVFGLDNRAGLTNILTGGATVEEVIMPTRIEGLLLLSSGPLPDNPVRVLRSQAMAEFVEEVSSLADFIIFDSPAGVAFADAALLASQTKNVILVHAAGSVPRGAEHEFRSRLDKIEANVNLAVLNKANPEESHGYFHYRRSYQPLRLRDGKEAAEVPAIAGEADQGPEDLV